MVLRTYNLRPKNDVMMSLHLSPTAQVKTCVAALSGGGIAAESVYLVFNALTMPVLGAGMAVAGFLGAMDAIENVMCKRALKNGDVVIRHHRRPKIDN